SIVPMPVMAAVDVNVNIALPPPIVFAAPPNVIVMPDANDVYVDPEVNVDLFFWNGWWWRPWEGRWYRSYYYDRGWGYYNNVPSFYFDVDPGWRGYYRDHNWYGHRWNYERIPYGQLQQNWKSWHNDRHWEKQGTWGVQNYQPRPQQQRQALRQQRQQQYQQRPEVQKQRQAQVQHPQQKHQESVKQPQRQEQRPETKHPQQQHQEKVKQPQKQEQRPEAKQPKHVQPQEKHEKGEEEKQERR
ncbi:MAG: hypothetical protein ACLP29_01705, partial [Dissulfurispiraceae bacterium]